MIELSLREHACGIRPWTEHPDEHRARRLLALVEATQRDVTAAIQADAIALAQADGDAGEEVAAHA